MPINTALHCYHCGRGSRVPDTAARRRSVADRDRVGSATRQVIAAYL